MTQYNIAGSYRQPRPHPRREGDRAGPDGLQGDLNPDLRPVPILCPDRGVQCSPGPGE